jgi:hypothetical protein
VERPQRFEPGQHPERTVEFAASRLGIKMRAHGDRRKLGILAGALSEHIADLVDCDRAAERLTLRFEPIAHLAVEVGQREAADAALRRRADLRRLHQRIPKSLCIDFEVVHVEAPSPAGAAL